MERYFIRLCFNSGERRLVVTNNKTDLEVLKNYCDYYELEEHPELNILDPVWNESQKKLKMDKINEWWKLLD